MGVAVGQEVAGAGAMELDARGTEAGTSDAADRSTGVEPERSITLDPRIAQDLTAFAQSKIGASSALALNERMQQWVQISLFMKDADRLLSAAETFTFGDAAELRTPKALQDGIREVMHNCSTVIRGASYIQETIVAQMQGVGSGSGLAAVLKDVTGRAEDVSLALQKATPDLTERVFANERFDQAQTKISELAASTLQTARYYLRESGLSANAQNFVATQIEGRINEILTPVRANPDSGIPDPQRIESCQREVASAPRFKIAVPGSNDREWVELPEDLRKQIAYVYKSLVPGVASLRTPDVYFTYLKGTTSSVEMRIDSTAQGEIKFSESVTGSSVTYRIDATKVKSGPERQQILDDIKRILQKSNAAERDSVEMTLLDYKNLQRAVAALSSPPGAASTGTDLVIKRLPVPESVSGYVIDLGSVDPGQQAHDVITGVSRVKITQRVDDANSRHVVEVVSKGGNISVELTGPRLANLRERVHVKVEFPSDQYAHGRDQRALRDALAAICSHLTPDLKLGGFTGKATDAPEKGPKPSGLVESILDLKDAKVVAFKGIGIGAGEPVVVKLAPEAVVDCIRVVKGGQLDLRGEGAARDKLLIRDVVQEVGGTTQLAISKATICDSRFEGLVIGKIQDSRVSEVKIPGRVRDFASSNYGRIGEPITDGKCTLSGCQWKRGVVGYWDTFKREVHLV